MSLFKKDIVLESDLANLRDVEGVIEEVVSVVSLGDDKYPNVLIAVTEAFNNAVMHGNKYDAGKKVNVHAEGLNEGVVFIVKDEGPGFDFDDLPDPTDPSNIEKFNGRGVFLMKNLADSVEFNDSGNEVTLKFLK